VAASAFCARSGQVAEKDRPALLNNANVLYANAVNCEVLHVSARFVVEDKAVDLKLDLITDYMSLCSHTVLRLINL
jgi:hypothetical protein